MLTFLGRPRRFCDGISRRDFLRVGPSRSAGCRWPICCGSRPRRRRPPAATPAADKSVIMVFLHGGPSHLDMYDMKPDAPVEFRGEFRPDPQQRARHGHLRADAPAGPDHRQVGHPPRAALCRRAQRPLAVDRLSRAVNRPAFGSVVSYLKGQPGRLAALCQPDEPAAVGRPGLLRHGPSAVRAHRAGLGKPGPGRRACRSTGWTIARQLLGHLDTIRRDIDYRGALAGLDAYTVRALGHGRLDQDPRGLRHRPRDAGGAREVRQGNEDFLRARRLVEAGISVVTLVVGGWDTHGNNFERCASMLPKLDQGIHALVSDLHERGWTATWPWCVWGEFGRTPRVNAAAGRDHWPRAGFAVLAGGNFKTGQTIGETDAHGESPKGLSMTSSHVLTSLYNHLGIDPAATIPDNNGRPMYLLDERDAVPGLV